MKIVQPPDFVIKSKNGTAGFLWDKKFAVRKNADFLKVQKYVDSTVLYKMKPYIPFRNGALEKSAFTFTVIGSGEIRQYTPYARYLYYGKVYGPNFPVVEENGVRRVVFGKYTGNGVIVGWVSPKGQRKHPTGRDLKYDTTGKHHLAGKMWFERMKADHKKEILQGAAKVAGGTTE